MTPERWQQVKELFESALECAPDERAAFLDHACDGDESLRGEVESLLASYEEGESFMERPAVALAAESLAGSRSESLIGQTIGHYQVIREIGRGGMGEVYLVQDHRLGRSVALKLLPTYLSKDEDRLRRFEQEARAASALNHPNVCVIYEVGETADDRHYIAMEYIDGVTLNQHMTSTRMTLTEVLDITIQVASALTAAHAVGIVHRDIKPENIMVRSDGYLKVLDFGLAKLMKQQATDLAAVAGARVKTDTGMVMGTSRYMSPEQVRGLAVDARTDIWSLGVMIYEMVTGRPPFEGATTSDVIVSILEREPPPLAQLSPDTPAELQRTISKALHKDKEERYQVIKDMLVDLKSLKQDVDFQAQRGSSRQSHSSQRGAVASGEVAPAREVRPWWRAYSLIVLVAGAALVISALAWFYSPRPGANPTMPTLPPMKTLPFTSFPGREQWPAFSPDGKQLAFRWDGEKEDNFDIYVKLIDAGAPLRLTTHPGIDSSPTWSPDSRYIAFSRFDKGESGIYMVPALGGPERKLLALSGKFSDLVWSPDGKSLAFTDVVWPQEMPSIFLLSIETREKRRLTSPPAQYFGDWYPAFSPDGQTLAFTRESSVHLGAIYLVPIQGGEPKRLTVDNEWIYNLDWTADGQSIVFASMRGGSRLWKVSAAGGTPEPLPFGGEHPFPRAMQFSISRQGHRLAYSILLDDPNIWRIEVPSSQGQRTSPIPLISSSQHDLGPQFSPDGQKIVFQSTRSGSPEIWVCSSDGTNPIQLTSLGRNTGAPRWSPDGRHIAFDSRAETNSYVYVINAEGGGPRRLTTETSNGLVPSWSRDGRFVYFCSNRSGTLQVWKVPAAGGEAVQVTKGGGAVAFESSDGKFLYYCKFDVAGLWRIPVNGGEESLVLDQPKEGYWGYWAVVDRGIYFIDPATKPRATLKLFSFTSRRVMQIAAIEKKPYPGVPGFAVSPDGRWILFTQLDQSGSDIMLVENFQ